MLSSRIASREPDVSELKRTVDQLSVSCPEQNLPEAYDDLHRRYTHAGQEACNAVLNLEQACESQRLYREALQDCEKWILQASYRLMAHNSLNVSSPELTAQHIDQHQALMREIEAYQQNLAQLKEQGEQLKAASQHQPALVQQVETQMANLDDSYASLQSTAAQIKVTELFHCLGLYLFTVSQISISVTSYYRRDLMNS